MSKGYGSVENGVLRALERWHENLFRQDNGTTGGSGLTLLQIAIRIPSNTGEALWRGETRWRNAAYRHLADSTRRALNTLERKGLVRVVMPRGLHTKQTWALKKWKPSAAERRRREEAQTETRRRYEKLGQGMRSPGHLGSPDTDRLSKILSILGSPEAGERDTAARMAEEERKRLGKSWDQLLR